MFVPPNAVKTAELRHSRPLTSSVSANPLDFTHTVVQSPDISLYITIAADVARSSLGKKGEEVQTSHDSEKPTLKKMLASLHSNTKSSRHHVEADTEEESNEGRYPSRSAKKDAMKKLTSMAKHAEDQSDKRKFYLSQS